MEGQETKGISSPLEEESSINMVESKIEDEASSSNGAAESCNRRFFLRPRKRPQSDVECVVEEFIQSPVKKMRKRSHTHLETIFEEPVAKNDGGILYVGLKKVKRYITFSQFVTKAKMKKRKSKLKRLKVNKISDKKKKKCFSIKEVEGKLTQLGI